MNKKWQEIRLKFFAPLVRKILPNRPEGMRYLGLENIESCTGKLLLDTEQTQVDSAVVIFDERSVLFGKLRPYLAKVAMPNFCGVASTEIMVFEPADNNDRKFISYLLLSDGFIKRVSGMTDGAKMPRVNPDDVLNLNLFIPEPSEQRRIAAYLDQQTAKIDRLIDLRRRQIALLKEQRAALIQQAVTRGLNPNVPMKDSGLLWLGEIPAHWEIKRLKYLSKINPCIPRVRIPKSTDEASFLPMERIGQDGSLDLSEKRIVNDISHGYTPMINGDVIVAKITPCFENGKGALCTNLIGGIGFGTTELIVLRANYEIDPRFLFWRTWCRDFRKLGESEMQGSAGQKRVTEDFISNFYLAKPPVKEQQQIIEFIKNQNIQFEKLNLSYSRQITLLTEYRAALIHECVTGRRQINDTFALEAK